jgi:hypothetical protein
LNRGAVSKETGKTREWYQRRTQPSLDARKPDRPDSQPASLDDLEAQRESERRYGHKRASKLFHDLIRWELYKIKEVMTLLRAEQRDILNRGKFDPFTVELLMAEDSALTDVRKGEVLRDPKLRPFYIHPLLDPNRILQLEKEEIDVAEF